MINKDVIQADVDDEIANYLRLGASRNFFLYAGAGSGKTSSLVEALLRVRATRGESMLASGAKVAVITYTNAATEEIQDRLGVDSLIDVSTIHSFAWNLVKDFPRDISAWLAASLAEDSETLREKEAKGRAGKASAQRKRDLARNDRVLADLPEIKRFTYNPTQTRASRGSLDHNQVLRVAAHLISEKPLMQEILVGRYPVLLIDEVQDTNKHLMSAFLTVSRNHPDRFALGLFGDTMQRIYNDGKRDLESSLSDSWGRPQKVMNYRSAKRIVKLVNQIRVPVDGRSQAADPLAADGQVRLFLADARTADRKTVEVEVREQMVSASEDENWTNGSGGVKVLILEHAMAAVRLGFVDFLNAFPTGNVRSKVTGRESIQTGTVHFLGSQVVPLVASLRGMQRFDADRLLRKFSPLLDSERASASEAERSDLVKVVRGAVARLSSLWESEAVVSLGHIVRCIHETGLLELPSELRDVLETQGELVEPLHGQPGLEDEEDPFLGAWKTAMDVEFDQFERYYNYAVGRSDLDTHQGVKGLEFQRVLVILDDSNARGFMFDYGKLFNASPLSDDDQKLIAAGEESTIDRTRRLLYVACSRAKNSLAVLLYSNDSEAAGATALGSGWFSEDEVVRL